MGVRPSPFAPYYQQYSNILLRLLTRHCDLLVPYGENSRIPKKPRIKQRGRKGEGTLFLRGRMWWYKSPDGTRYPTSTTNESDGIDFKICKLAELRIDLQPHIKSTGPKVTVNELLDARVIMPSVPTPSDRHETEFRTASRLPICAIARVWDKDMPS